MTPNTGDVTIVAVSVVNTISGKGGTTPDTLPPIISNITATALDSLTETISFSTNEDTVAFIDYGKSTAYSDNVGDPTFAQSHSLKIRGLTMGTEYHFRVKAIDRGGNQTASDDMTFKTTFLSELVSTSTAPLDDADLLQSKIEDLVESALPSLTAPFLAPPQITDITENSATVSWKTNVKAYGFLSYASDDEFSKNPEVYTLDMTSGTTKQTTHLVKLSGLKSNTTYHIRASGYVFEKVVGKTDDITFTTKPAQIAGSITERTKDSFTVAWATEEPTSSIVEYIDKKTGIAKRSIDKNMRLLHSLRIDNLPSGVTYEVNISGVNEKSNSVEASSPLMVTTLRDVTSPTISGLKVDNALVPGRTRVQTVISWKTDEPADSIVYYEEGAGGPNDTDELANQIADKGTFVLNHSVVQPNMKPGAVYRIKVSSADDSGNRASFGPRTIITPQENQSVTDIIFKNFEDSFKFLRKI